MNVKARVKTERKRVTLPIVTRGFMELNECSRRTAQVRTDCRVVFFFILRNIPDQVMNLCQL